MGSRIVCGLAVVSALVAPAVAEAGAWTRPEGTGYLKIWNRTLVGTGVFTSAGDIEDLPTTYQDHQLNLYGEWGLTDDWTVVADATALGVALYDGASQVYTGGAAAGLRYRLSAGPVVAAVQARFGARPGRAAPLGTGVVAGEPVELRPVVGTFHGGGQASVGYGWTWGWVTGGLGARFFTSEVLQPALTGSLQLGLQPFELLTLDVHLNWFHATGELEPTNALGAGQTRYLGWGVGATLWVVPRVGIHVGFDGVAYAAANAATPSLLLGVELR